MGMFDWYEPQPPIRCPKCGVTLAAWQGKSGPCALFEWVQGHRAPRRQLVDEDVAMSPAALEDFFLPDDFEVYAECSTCETWVEAHGSCDAGIWTRVELVNPLEPPGLPDGWMPLLHEDRLTTGAELRREIGKGHVLHGCKLFPLGRRRDRDDVLVRAVGATAPLWIVHLTWRAELDPAWPRIRPFDDLAAFVAAQDTSG
jgi:hypothetical protein